MARKFIGQWKQKIDWGKVDSHEKFMQKSEEENNDQNFHTTSGITDTILSDTKTSPVEKKDRINYIKKWYLEMDDLPELKKTGLSAIKYVTKLHRKENLLKGMNEFGEIEELNIRLLKNPTARTNYNMDQNVLFVNKKDYEKIIKLNKK